MTPLVAAVLRPPRAGDRWCVPAASLSFFSLERSWCSLRWVDYIRESELDSSSFDGFLEWPKLLFFFCFFVFFCTCLRDTTMSKKFSLFFFYQLSTAWGVVSHSLSVISWRARARVSAWHHQLIVNFRDGSSSWYLLSSVCAAILDSWRSENLALVAWCSIATIINIYIRSEGHRLVAAAISIKHRCDSLCSVFYTSRVFNSSSIIHSENTRTIGFIGVTRAKTDERINNSSCADLTRVCLLPRCALQQWNQQSCGFRPPDSPAPLGCA